MFRIESTPLPESGTPVVFTTEDSRLEIVNPAMVPVGSVIGPLSTLDASFKGHVIQTLVCFSVIIVFA